MSSSPEWADDPLAFLIDPIPKEIFFAEYHEKRHLCCHRDEPGRYSNLLSIERIDELIADSELPPNAIQMARSEPAIKRRDFSYQNGNIDRGAVVRHYQQGATVILPQMHLADAMLFDFCNCMEKQFSTGVQTNIYLTPPGHQGFNTHYDDHDVFVIQIKGKKRWRIFNNPIENPYKGERFNSSTFDASDVKEEFILKAGDCVYVPRGLAHDAQSIGEEPSLHITIGTLVKTWADLMLESMSSVALRHSSFRKSLPPGYALNNFDTKKTEEYFKNLVNTFSKEVNFEEVFEMFIDNFIRSQGPIVRGGIINGTKSINKKDKFKRRVNSQYRIRESEKSVILVCAGGDIIFNLNQANTLEKSLTGKPFSLNDIKDIEIEDAKDVVKKLLAFGVIEKL